MADKARATGRVPMGPPARCTASPSPAAAPNRSPLRCGRRISVMKNRMREIRTSGSVRGGDGDIPTYSAAYVHDTGLRTRALVAVVPVGLNVALVVADDLECHPRGAAGFIAVHHHRLIRRAATRHPHVDEVVRSRDGVRLLIRQSKSLGSRESHSRRTRPLHRSVEHLRLQPLLDEVDDRVLLRAAPVLASAAACAGGSSPREVQLPAVHGTSAAQLSSSQRCASSTVVR